MFLDPYVLPQRWPFCWWLAVAVDHYSRRIMGFTVLEQPPTSVAIRAFLGRATRQAGTVPQHLITDQGTQFTDEGFGRGALAGASGNDSAPSASTAASRSSNG